MTLWLALLLVAQEPPIAGGQDIREQIACAPMSATEPPAAALHIAGSAYRGRTMFGPGDAVVLNAGTEQGVQKGQMYYVRRQVRDNFTPVSTDFLPISIHTAGWVTVVDVKDYVSIATVTHACDGVLYGDYLEPFTSPVVPTPALSGEPDFANPARIVMGDERRQTGSAGSLMLINRGSELGVRAGQTLTIYRPTMSGLGPILDVGRATVLSVRPKTALVRIDSSREAVYIGDLAAIHRMQE
jgi:hypothetical protein